MENLAVERKFVISSSPHVRSPETVQKIMIDVLIALVPAVVAAAVFFREEAIIPIIICLVAAMGTEFVLVRKGGFFSDGSAAVTGVLLALTLPPGVAWWICVIGSATAIILGKYIFGGLGSNTFNPALVGRAILLASWGGRMTEWLGPIDLRSTATPLADPGYGTPLMDLFTGNVAGCLGETSAIALLLGGAYLMYKKHINWRIPGTYIVSAFIIGTLLSPMGTQFDVTSGLFHVLAGGLLLGAIFMATDMVTSPVTTKGQLIFGAGCGILTVLIRIYGMYPEGVTFAILIMNALTPLIDGATKPRIYGEVSK
ncbi:MAG: electron transporter RnfD [Tindallia sp. MSAO_Bac2]|nr:MAG: electron transporter RnfD [Tindallia sp. MSAO_Bac2]